MKRYFFLFSCLCAGTFAVPAARAADAPPPAQVQPAAPAGEPTTEEKNTIAAAAAVTMAKRDGTHSPDFLEHLVDVILELFNVRTSGNTVTHYVISALLLACALLARRIVTGIIFVALKKLAAKTETTLDDKLFPAMEAPAAAFVMVTGIFAALKVLKLSAEADQFIGYGSRVAFSLAIFWGLWRAFNAILDHAQEVAHERQMSVAAFMPWIKKTLITLFAVLGVLLTAQSLGFEVRAFLAGLGIGGLAFALAAQDTLANLFGSIVVAIDQPFKLGQAVKIGAHTGTVEDIGLRSTKIRLIDKSLVVIPNKTVAAESIVNLSRFTQRRVEQVIGLTYDTTPEQMEAIVEEIRQIILREQEVDPSSVMVYFRDYSASSLDIWIVYASKSADFQPGMQLRQRINLGIMRAVTVRGLAFAFPTQTMHLPGEVAQKLAERAPGRGA
jgi:MscS family membrane protein